MVQFMFTQPVKISFGAGKVSELGEIMDLNGSKKAFIATDEGIVKAGIIKKVTDALDKAGKPYYVFDKIKPDAPAVLVEEGFKELASSGCDCVIAVGGGSTIDSSKGINLLRVNPAPLEQYKNFQKPVDKAPGMIAIPTTAGTGSELSDGVILCDDNHQKFSILSLNALPDYVILDPTLLVGTPGHITASTGYDALSHVTEGILSVLANEMSDTINKGAVQEVLKWLPIAFNEPNNVEARAHMQAAAAIGGWMLGHVHCNSGHSFAHVLGAMFNMPHGFGCAYAMPYVTEFNAVEWPEKTKMVGELFGVKFAGNETPEQIGKMVCDAMVHLRDVVLKMKPAKEFPHDPARFDEAAAKVMDEVFQLFNPRKMTPADARKILDKIYA